MTITWVWWCTQEEERKRTAEAQQRVEQLKKELLATQVELDQRDHTHEVRVSALHMQRDEIARLKDLINKLKQCVPRAGAGWCS